MANLNRREFLHNAGIAGAATVGVAATGAGAAAPSALLTDEELAYLRRFDTPTISNALERRALTAVHKQNRLTGAMTPKIRCIFPEMGIANGYAATATIQASKPRKSGSNNPYGSGEKYREYINSIPSPTFMVIHDLDAPNPVGSWWGEVNANVHRALGCVGVITDGGVRDLSVVRPLGFHFFAAEVLVSHAYVHVVDFGKPVTVGEVTVESGDLLQADEHGVIHVPSSVAKQIGPACYDVFKSERALIEHCQKPGMTFEKLQEFYRNR